MSTQTDPDSPQPVLRDAVAALYHNESRRILATLIRLLGDFDLAEDAMHTAFRLAIEQWPRDGIPVNPRAWLVSTARFKAIDALRRQSRHEAPLDDADAQGLLTSDASQDDERQDISDDRLRLIFTCCHPSLPADARVALTLREVCGLSTEAIASAYLSAPATLAQRIVRAKAKIKAERTSYQVPTGADLPERLQAVLQVVYLVFNEGYAASSGDSLTRPDLSAEAIRLGRVLVALLPEAQAQALLALMLLHESRRAARSTLDGDVILLEEQDRTKWTRALIDEGLALTQRAWDAGERGAYALQAAIAALHAVAPSVEQTDWRQIVGLYDLLLRHAPTPVVALNRAAALAMRDGPAAGLAEIDAILTAGELANYHPAHAARGELCRRLGRLDDARASFRRALDLAQQGPERRMLQKRLAALPV